MISIEDILNESKEFNLQQREKEIYDFVDFLKDKNIKNILEIGSAGGATFYLWCKISDLNGKKISVDIPYAYINKEHRNNLMRSWSDNVFLIDGDSHDSDVLEKVKFILDGEKLDLLFIDGDHSYNGVKKDYEMYSPLVRNGGLIAFHDIKGEDNNRDASGYVSVFWNELSCEKIEFKDEDPAYGIGVIEKAKSIDKDNSIFVVGAWSDTDSKNKLLKECILNIRTNSDIPILLVSHMVIDSDIVNLVDYFIYDKHNPLIKVKNFEEAYRLSLGRFWFYDDIRMTITSKAKVWHDFTVWLNLVNSFNFAKSIEKENVFYIEYDCVVNFKKFSELFIEPLYNNDICLVKDFHYGSINWLNIFSAKTDCIVDIVNKIKDKYSYMNLTKKFESKCAEFIFYKLISEEKNIKIFETNDVDNLFTKNQKHVISPDIISYGDNDLGFLAVRGNESKFYKDRCFLFFCLLSETSKREDLVFVCVMPNGLEYNIGNINNHLFVSLGLLSRRDEKGIVKVYDKNRNLLKEYYLSDIYKICMESENFVSFKDDKYIDDLVEVFNTK